MLAMPVATEEVKGEEVFDHYYGSVIDCWLCNFSTFRLKDFKAHVDWHFLKPSPILVPISPVKAQQPLQARPGVETEEEEFSCCLCKFTTHSDAVFTAHVQNHYEKPKVISLSPKVSPNASEKEETPGSTTSNVHSSVATEDPTASKPKRFFKSSRTKRKSFQSFKDRLKTFVETRESSIVDTAETLTDPDRCDEAVNLSTELSGEENLEAAGGETAKRPKGRPKKRKSLEGADILVAPTSTKTSKDEVENVEQPRGAIGRPKKRKNSETRSSHHSPPSSDQPPSPKRMRTVTPKMKELKKTVENMSPSPTKKASTQNTRSDVVSEKEDLTKRNKIINDLGAGGDASSCKLATVLVRRLTETEIAHHSSPPSNKPPPQVDEDMRMVMHNMLTKSLDPVSAKDMIRRIVTRCCGKPSFNQIDLTKLCLENFNETFNEMLQKKHDWLSQFVYELDIGIAICKTCIEPFKMDCRPKWSRSTGMFYTMTMKSHSQRCSSKSSNQNSSKKF